MNTKILEYEYEVPDNNGYLIITQMTNQTLREVFELNDSDKVIVQIRKKDEPRIYTKTTTMP